MELVNLYIWGSIGAAFCLIVGALIGHAIYDRQQMARNAVQRDHLSDVTEKWRTLLQEAHAETLARESELKESKEHWAFADNFRKTLVQTLIDHDLWDFTQHGGNPAIMLTTLCNHVAECAIDPKQNQKAKNLYVKGVRAGAKKGREQTRKLMQKSIDNQAATIQNAWIANSKKDNVISAQATEHELYREAVRVTLTDKVGLVGVRRAIVQGIAAECARLRAVETNKGE